MQIYKYVQFSIIIIIIIHLLLVDHLSKTHSLMHGHGTYYYYYYGTHKAQKMVVLKSVQVMLSHIQFCTLPLGSQ